jgi:adenosine deaminase
LLEQTTTPLNIFHAIPKVDLHRHLEGSLRLTTMVEIARAHGLTIPPGVMSLSGLVQVQDRDPLTSGNFLDKFKTLRLFYRSPDVIHRITMEAVEDAARDNIRYLELRFTPVALSRAEGFPLHDVMDWVITSAQEAAQVYGLRVGLIASVNRHESVELAEQVAWLAAEHVSHGMRALDLAGNEAEFPAAPFAGVFNEACQAGLNITVHAGEWAGAQNVRQAIELLGAQRIGHGVRVLEDDTVGALAAERGTTFEVCLTSNYQSGVIPDLNRHPLRLMIGRGLNVTLNTDDPSVSRITLGHEYQVACRELGLPLLDLKGCVLAAAQAAFLPEAERLGLVSSLETELASGAWLAGES